MKDLCFSLLLLQLVSLGFSADIDKVDNNERLDRLRRQASSPSYVIGEFSDCSPPSATPPPATPSPATPSPATPPPATPPPATPPPATPPPATPPPETPPPATILPETTDPDVGGPEGPSKLQQICVHLRRLNLLFGIEGISRGTRGSRRTGSRRGSRRTRRSSNSGRDLDIYFYYLCKERESFPDLEVSGSPGPMGPDEVEEICNRLERFNALLVGRSRGTRTTRRTRRSTRGTRSSRRSRSSRRGLDIFSYLCGDIEDFPGFEDSKSESS